MKILVQRFASTYKFSNHDINKLISVLRKDVYPYEKMFDQEQINETPLPEKAYFNSRLNMGDIIDANYKKEFIKILNKKFR